MVGVTRYDWLLLFHVLTAVLWVGGAAVIQMMGTRALRRNDPAELMNFAGEVEWIGSRIFVPTSLIMLGLGIWMVIDVAGWKFTQFWILAGLGVFAYSFLGGAFYLGPRMGKLKKLYATEGPTAPAAPPIIRRVTLISRIELALMVLVIADMVIKPGL